MSIPVELNSLAEVMMQYPFAYLLTTRAGAAPHAVAVTAVMDGGELVVAATGQRPRANALQAPAVSLVWPPSSPQACRPKPSRRRRRVCPSYRRTRKIRYWVRCSKASARGAAKPPRRRSSPSGPHPQPCKGRFYCSSDIGSGWRVLEGLRGGFAPLKPSKSFLPLPAARHFHLEACRSAGTLFSAPAGVGVGVGRPATNSRSKTYPCKGPGVGA